MTERQQAGDPVGLRGCLISACRCGGLVWRGEEPLSHIDIHMDPWLWTAPIGLSVGAFIFVDHDHHFDGGHRFAHFGHMHRFEGRHGFGRSAGGGRLS